MNINKYTEKAREAVAAAIELAGAEQTLVFQTWLRQQPPLVEQLRREVADAGRQTPGLRYSQ